MSATRLETLRQTPEAQALRLDERDAPQREIARRQQESDDARTSQEKARAANKAAFRP